MQHTCLLILCIDNGKALPAAHHSLLTLACDDAICDHNLWYVLYTTSLSPCDSLLARLQTQKRHKLKCSDAYACQQDASLDLTHTQRYSRNGMLSYLLWRSHEAGPLSCIRSAVATCRCTHVAQLVAGGQLVHRCLCHVRVAGYGMCERRTLQRSSF